jgi:hypothetical protein
MAEQVLDWGLGFPASQNNDTTTELSLGTRFTLSQSAPVVGVQVQVPTTLPSGPTPAFVSIWDTGPNILAFQSFDWSDFLGAEGTEQIVYFVDDNGVDGQLPAGDLASGTTYVAVVQTFERWAGTTGYGFPITTGIITAGAANGWVLVGYGYPATQSGAGFSFGVSPVMDVAESQPMDPADETDEALPLARIKRRLLGAVDELGTALALGASKRRALGFATETSVALSFGAGSSGSTIVPRPSIGTVSRPDDGIIHRPEVAYP